jgi:hypothetical protein
MAFLGKLCVLCLLLFKFVLTRLSRNGMIDPE